MAHVWMWLLITLAGFGAGALNSVVGSGTLLTFPTLLAFGIPPVTANVSNNLGLVSGALAAFRGSRHELIGDKSRLPQMLGWSGTGALLGALAVLKFPAKSFTLIVPFLILFGLALMLLQPVIVKLHPHTRSTQLSLPLRLTIFVTGIYGGYFGAAQGVILIGLLTAFAGETLFRANAYRALICVVGLTAAVKFWLP